MNHAFFGHNVLWLRKSLLLLQADFKNSITFIRVSKLLKGTPGKLKL